MPLKLFYITNRPEIAQIADETGVDRVFIDMEYIGKDLRQGGMDTVQNHHTIQDIRKIKPVIKHAELLVRVNPIHNSTPEYECSETEIRQAIDAGADVVMLPMYRTVDDIQRFVRAVNGEAKTLLLCETPEAVEVMPEVIKLCGVNEIHIGLNDLHLALKKKFMFELLADGTVEKIVNIIKDSDITYGFGGIARIGYGTLPAEKIIAEHYRLGSNMAILSRSFCNADKIDDICAIRDLFFAEVTKIRKVEKVIAGYTPFLFEMNRQEVIKLTQSIVNQCS